MKKILATLLMVMVLIAVLVSALASGKGPDIDNLIRAGWVCDEIGREPHCLIKAMESPAMVRRFT